MLMIGLAPSIVFALASGPTTEPPKIVSHTSPNGLTVLVVENHAIPLVTIEIAAKNGSMTEPPDYNGLSHLYEHMFFKANAALPTQEAWLARSRELGMQWNGTTNTERVNYFFTTTADHFADAMVFMRDAIVTPVFDPKELERERVVVTGEIDRNEASPYYYLYRAVNDRVWWKHPSRKDPLGRRKTVLATTVKQMKTIKERYYVPNNSVLVVTGDVDAADVFAKADELYAGWKRGPDPFKRNPLVKHPPIKKTEVVVVEQKVKTITGQMVWHGPSTVGPSVADSYPADSLGTYVGEPSSKFQKNLVDAGHCISAGMGWYTQMNTGPITLGWEATPEKADACVKAIVAELAAMRSPDYAGADDLLRAAHEIEVDTVRDTERPSQFSHTLTFWWTSAGIDYLLGYVPNLYKVTGADVVRYIDTYVTGKPFVFAVMLSPEMKAAGLDAAHFEAVLGLANGAK